MKILSLKTNSLNQNNYNKNILTPENVGSLLIYPVGYTPETCLSCDGYILKIVDYELLYSVIGTKFNSGTEAEDEFRIPDYNVTKRFLQPGSNVGTQIAAGLPNIVGHIETRYRGQFYNASGAFKTSSIVQDLSGAGVSSAYQQADFKAFYSNSLYGKSSTVQPPSQIVHVCIRYK